MKKYLIIIIMLLASLTSAAIQKIGIVTDTHVGNRANSGVSFYTESLVRMTTVMVAFNAASVDLMIGGGDWVDEYDDYDAVWDDLIDLMAIYNDNTTYPNLSGVVRLYTVGNHDFDNSNEEKGDFIIALGNNANDELIGENYPTATEQSYGYYDLGNLRIIILDCNFDEDDNDDPSVSGTYISESQLNWLQTTLTATDTAGKWAVIVLHKGPISLEHSSNGVINTGTVNIQRLLDITSGHNVSCGIFGHSHWALHSYTSPTCIDSQGRRILWKHLHGMVDSDSLGAANASYGIAYINDTDGSWYFDGPDTASLEKGTCRAMFAGHASSTATSWTNLDYWDGDSWETPGDSDMEYLVTYDKAYMDTYGTSRTSLGDGSFNFKGGMCEIIISPDWTAPIGAGNGTGGSNLRGLQAITIGSLYIGGAFAANTDVDSTDFTWIYPRYGCGYVEVNGSAGAGTKILLSNDGLEGTTADKSWWNVIMDPGDATKTLEFNDTTDSLNIQSLSLYSGIIDVIDIRPKTSGYSINEAVVYGGKLQLSRGADNVAVTIGILNMYAGTFDLTTGSNAGNGKTVATMNIYGPAIIDLDITGLVFTNPINLYKQPTSWDFHATTQHSMTFYDRIMLTDSGDGINIGTDYTKTGRRGRYAGK